MMATRDEPNELNPFERERELLVTSIEEAYEALRLIPGVDANGPALVWLADHLMQAHMRYEHHAVGATT
jgi:hypothetical protein